MSLPRRSLPAGFLPEALTAVPEALAGLREALSVPTAFPTEVEAEAARVAARGPRPDPDRVDARDVPLVTIDPPGSRDLDQALHVEARGNGHRARYAIADVGAFVDPGGAIDAEAWERGVSRYSPDIVTPLHPLALSADAASLLPGRDRPAVLWTIDTDAEGGIIGSEVRRATVRSRAQLTYAEAQRAIDEGSDPMLLALSRLGRQRVEREWVRGGVSLELPDQEVVRDDNGGFVLRFRAPLPVEEWNAQMSLLTGIVAGTRMRDAGQGILRTLPAPEEAAIDGLRRRAWALGLPWPPEVGYADFVRTLDPHEPLEAAMISAAAVGLRGAGYLAFDGDLPADHRHEALAAPYAHVTAPLRRLVDRYAAEVVLVAATDRPLPGWVTERLDDLPKAMARARGRAAALDRAVVDLVEAHVLAGRVGERFAATVVRVGDAGSDVQLRAPAVLVRIDAELRLGTEVQVRLDHVDVGEGTVTFVPA